MKLPPEPSRFSTADLVPWEMEAWSATLFWKAVSSPVIRIAPRTADRLWAFGRAWLHRELVGTPADPKYPETMA